MYRLWIFLLVNLWIIYISWRSLSKPRSHGFYRFFAFETLLVMALANSGRWFYDPFSLHQIISWLCLVSSALLALHGLYLLKKSGRPQETFEDTTVLVQAGAYRFIRHPMYASLLLLGVGIFMKDFSLLNSALLLGLLAFLTMAGRMEEQENLQRFGPAYSEYLSKTKMFIPFIY